VTLRLCLYCGRDYHSGTGVRGRRGDCGRAYDRELSRQKRARQARNSARRQKATSSGEAAWRQPLLAIRETNRSHDRASHAPCSRALREATTHRWSA